ncbi:MAG: right-handed parallel beta-helix repeat-containing protein [Paludibacteraceae bacterium]|nr:right-handed parallel beta-helix repeat-containing protein [Paludibacteraceae bacterium]
MKKNRFVYFTIVLLYCIITFTSCKAESVDDPNIAPYIKDLYIENADQSKTYYIRQIRRNVNGVWLVSIGAANSVSEDKSDGSSQVLVYSYGKNVEDVEVLPLSSLNGFNGFGYISLDWKKIPEGKEILCRSKINTNGFRMNRDGEIARYLNKRFGTFSKSSHHDKFEKLEKVRHKDIKSVKSNDNYVINVNNQQDFDKLNETLKSLVESSKKNIIVDIADGKYLFKESHLDLRNVNNSGLTITLNGGNNTILFGSGSLTPKIVSSFDHNHIYLNKKFENKDMWTDVKQMKDTIEIVDLKNKLCRIKSVDPINNQLYPKCKLKVTEWFKTLIYDVLKFENGYIYFYAPELSYTEWISCYNVNQDWGYGKKYPRYRLFYQANGSMKEPLLDCSSSLFLNVENCSINGIFIKNIKFYGNSLKKPSLISIKNVKTSDFRISNCEFSAIRNKVVDVANSQNVILEDNQVKNCYIDCFVSDNECVGFVAQRNFFINNCLCMNNTACVVARGKDFLVADNIFCDFSYSAISVGMNYQWKKDAECSGIVENNEIHYSSEYFNHPEKYCLMDGGAIYVMTQLDDVIVRYNRIYDYCGVYANRGIFCDDGTKNISIYGNVITNVPNSFSIDLRLCPQVASRVSDHNRNIMMMYNLMDGKYRFEGVDKNSAFLGANFLISKKFGTKLENVVSNVSFADEDYYMEGSVEFGAKNLILQSNSRNIIMQSPIRTYISRYIK